MVFQAIYSGALLIASSAKAVCTKVIQPCMSCILATMTYALKKLIGRVTSTGQQPRIKLRSGMNVRKGFQQSPGS
jgi:hypothetical protein